MSTNFSPAQLREILSRPNYTLGHAAMSYPPLAAGLPTEKPKPSRRRTLGRKAQAAETRSPSVAVIVTRCSSGRLDRDNNYSAAKPLIDALREAGRIPNDTESDIELFVFQKKVKREEAGTLIEILPIP